MPRKAAVSTAPTAPVAEWDRNNTEPWYNDFEKEPVNDAKWTCIVTAAVQTETRDEDCIQTYLYFASSGLRKSIKTISMSDVIALLRENSGTKGKKEETGKHGKLGTTKTSVSSFDSTTSQMVELAAKYATLTDSECRLPPDLMAAVVKFLILKIKRENCFEKRVEAVRARKIREQNIKAKFIRSLKPYESSPESKTESPAPSKQEVVEESIDDHPLGGPDLYIMLVDFYDLYCFPEMLKIHIPFVAILKIATVHSVEAFQRVPLPSAVDPEASYRKSILVSTFWKDLKSECTELGKTGVFKDIALMQYIAPSGYLDSKQYLRTIFDELTWMQYSAYCIYGQHQKYLEEMHVQRLILSLEPLDLSKCNVYNKLCDALITGEPLTPLMVLYAIVEQVVVGVPETKSTTLEYLPKSNAFFSCTKRSTMKKKTLPKNITLMCKSKQEVSCAQTRASEGTVISRDCSEHATVASRTKGNSSPSLEKVTDSSDSRIAESLIDQVLSERKLENENKTDKKWKTPFLCFHGDSVFRQSFYCDPRIFDADSVVRRFLANSDFFPIWSEYPQLPPEEKAYFNYHFFTLWKISQQRQDLLKLKIFFTLAAKLIGVTRSYVYRGDEENASDILSALEKERPKFSTTKLEQNMTNLKESVAEFYEYFLKTIIDELYILEPRKAVITLDSNEQLTLSDKTGPQVLEKTTDRLNTNPYQSSSRICEQDLSNLLGVVSVKTLVLPLKPEKGDTVLSSLLECPEITSLTDTYLQHGSESYLNIIKSFKFYEKLEPNLMVQRLLEAGRCFNTFQCSHFLPTDSLAIIMYDDFDHRGVFYTTGQGALSTPVALRDFYSYVYPEITEWLIAEMSEHSKFVAEQEEKVKALEDKEDAEYLERLKMEYCKMNSEERKEFLETVVDVNSEPEVTEDELGTLPNKPRRSRPRDISFVTTNLTDLRVENNRSVNEFHSRDGTKVRASIENWLYFPSRLLNLQIKRANFLLYYSQWLDQEINTAFTFKTESDLIFSFYGNMGSENDFKYDITISWPTGLLIRPVWLDSTLYVKQNYLPSCRNGWSPEEEESRCFLKNGQIIVFKSNGDYDVLCSSGTKYSFYDSETTPRYEIISTTGEVWEIRPKGPCRGRRKLITRNKIFLGVDPKTHETYYKRDDGTHCMLWQNGRLVTSYPDGTKITTLSYFDDEEIKLEWTEEEKLFFEQLVQRYKSEQSVQEPRSRTILRNSSATKGPEAKPVEFEGFISVSCAYLMEHPKYSTVYVNPSNPYLKLTLPENLSILIYPEGTYEIHQDVHFLRVFNSEVEFQTICNSCDDASTVKLYLDSRETLCSFVDFFQKTFFVMRNGDVSFQELTRESEDKRSVDTHKSDRSQGSRRCSVGHFKRPVVHQRCFALERDLSGVEFLHEDCIAIHASKTPVDTYHEKHKDEAAADVSHTFSSYYYKAGYENWVMDYEDHRDSLPVNIKKGDLKELGAKQIPKNLFQYPFPKYHNCGSQQQTDKVQYHKPSPKLIVTRTFLSLPSEPSSVINEIQKYVTDYQIRAREVHNTYMDSKSEPDCSEDSRHVEMRLRKIALTLTQSLHMYPHLCTQLPSTEKDIHYFGHFINSAQEIKRPTPQSLCALPKCKQIPIPLPRSSEFSPIDEELDSPKNKQNMYNH